VVVVAVERSLPTEEDSLAVVRRVRVADDALRIVQQRAQLRLAVLQLQQTQGRPRREVALVLGVGLPLGVRVVRPAQIVVLGEDHPAEHLLVRLEAGQASGAARVQIEFCPAGIVAGSAGALQCGQTLAEPRRRRSQSPQNRVQHLQPHALAGAQVVLRDPIGNHLQRQPGVGKVLLGPGHRLERPGAEAGRQGLTPRGALGVTLLGAGLARNSQHAAQADRCGSGPQIHSPPPRRGLGFRGPDVP